MAALHELDPILARQLQTWRIHGTPVGRTGSRVGVLGCVLYVRVGGCAY